MKNSFNRTDPRFLRGSHSVPSLSLDIRSESTLLLISEEKKISVIFRFFGEPELEL